ncbi:MAG: DUF418 domain-containing protein [Spirosomataceae bacterium]
METLLQTPIAQKDRIFILDAIRGVALLGILLMNIPGFGQAYEIYDNLAVYNEMTGPNFWAWAIVNGGFEGTMRGLFSILFGASSLLLLDRLLKNNSSIIPADIYFRRLLWMLLFGVINAFVLLWPGDILYSYALCGFLLFPFRSLNPRQLLIASLIVLAIATYKENASLYRQKDKIENGKIAEALDKKKVKLNDEQKKDLEAWHEMAESSSVKHIKEEVEKVNKKIRAGYVEAYQYMEDVNINIQSREFHQFGVWDIMLFLFLGMALFKWGVLTNQQPAWLYWVFMLVGYGVGLTLNYVEMSFEYHNHFDAIKHTENWWFEYYEIRRVFHTLGHLGLLVLMYRSGWFGWFFNILSPVGQMAFTNYLSQTIICGVIFNGSGLGWFGYLERYQLYEVVAGIWVFQVIFSNIWMKYYQFGPLEWVWRSLTYWRKQPIRRA